MFCPKCGTDNPDDAPYCRLCLERFTPLPPSAAADPAADASKAVDRVALAVVGLVFALVLVIAVFGVLSKAGFRPFDYSVSRYDVRFTPVVQSGTLDGDVDVRMLITYSVGAWPKTGGFKFVGDRTTAVTDVTVTDEAGRALDFEADDLSYREHRISWHLPFTMLGKRTVVVGFRRHDALARSADGCVRLDADWARDFSVPVHNATFRLVTPPGVAAPSFATQPPGGVISTGDLGTEIRIDQPTMDADSVRFGTGAFAADVDAVAWARSLDDAVSSTSGVPLLPTVLIPVILVLVLVRIAGRTTGTGRGSWGSSGGGGGGFFGGGGDGGGGDGGGGGCGGCGGGGGCGG